MKRFNVWGEIVISSVCIAPSSSSSGSSLVWPLRSTYAGRRPNHSLVHMLHPRSPSKSESADYSLEVNPEMCQPGKLKWKKKTVFSSTSILPYSVAPAPPQPYAVLPFAGDRFLVQMLLPSGAATRRPSAGATKPTAAPSLRRVAGELPTATEECHSSSATRICSEHVRI